MRGISLLFGLLAHAVAVPAAPQSSQQVDYVIIGGGPAGFVVAEYLSRNPEVNVVLLEAGPDLDNDVDINTPAKFAINTQGVWPFLVEPDPNLDGLTPDLGQGMAFGGGSAINAQIYCRGAASVFDEWAETTGNDGLAWESMLEAFQATSRWEDEVSIQYDQPVNTSSFGDGPLAVSRQRKLFALDRPFVETMASELDLEPIDFVSGGSIGYSQGLDSIRAQNRTRSYAYNSFGYLANTRPNFRALHNAWVSSVNFDGETATGVTYNDTTSNRIRTVTARETILAGGAINTPHLLMLSGLGPASTLSAFNIPVIRDIPEIGQNLADHHLAVLEYAVTPEQITLWQWQYNATVAAAAEAAYAANGDGVLGTQNGDALAGVRIPDSVFDGLNSTWYQDLPADRAHVIYEYISASIVESAPNVSAVSAWVGLTQPEGKGSVSLNSANYRDAPQIVANYWGSESDRAAVLYAYKQLRGIMTHPALAHIITEELIPGPEATTDEQLWASIQETSRSWHHPVGTVSMTTVLDVNWRVKGVNGLRVVGSAAAPSIPTCPIQASVYALGHRAAVDIAEADGL
ncbi:hypothetical protein BJX76DRAFT_360902 [Aspergillus varians]